MSLLYRCSYCRQVVDVTGPDKHLPNERCYGKDGKVHRWHNWKRAKKVTGPVRQVEPSV